MTVYLIKNVFQIVVFVPFFLVFGNLLFAFRLTMLIDSALQIKYYIECKGKG